MLPHLAIVKKNPRTLAYLSVTNLHKLPLPPKHFTAGERLALGYFKNRLLYRFGALRKRFGAQFKFGTVEINITHMVDRNQMDMRMGDFQAYYRYTAPFAGVYALNALRNNLGKNPQPHVLIVPDIEQVIGFLLGDNQYVPLSQGIDI